MRLRHQAEGKSIALVAEYRGAIAGYVNLYPNSGNGPFADRGYPEIVDFGVLEKYRKNGVGTKLMEIAPIRFISVSNCTADTEARRDCM